MTKDDIIRMAREAGIEVYDVDYDYNADVKSLERFANIAAESAAKAEREKYQKDAERYQYLKSIAAYEGSSDWTIEVWGRTATLEEAIDEAISENPTR
jgi:hypothetical protein